MFIGTFLWLIVEGCPPPLPSPWKTFKLLCPVVVWCCCYSYIVLGGPRFSYVIMKVNSP